nr:retrovirus-related Pol polyprotein from transposon TNT 1-94 [Tanacetum cinerariifolium]
MLTQQDIYAAGFESRPPMLNKENYVPWSSHLLRYAKSRPNGMLIHKFILNGPYVIRMIPEPGDANRDVNVTETFPLQTNDELSDKELKQIEADDQPIQNILLGLPEDIYAAVDSCETAQENWLRTKDLHTADYTQLYDFLKYNQKEVDELKAERLAKTQDPLALMANSNNPYVFPAPHQDHPSFNQNYLQQPMPNPEDITDRTTAMNMALSLMAKAFKLNYSTPTNNNQRISSNPRNWQITQPGMNMGQDRQMQMIREGRGRNLTPSRRISELNKQFSKEKSTVSFLLEEKKKLKFDFKTSEDKILDKQIQLEKRIKELNNIMLKTGQSIQTIHMLSSKPNSFYHTEQKMALGYQNPFYLKQAQKKQQSLYDGKVLLEKHDPPVVHDSEETLQLAQESRDKMKQMNKEIKPANYTKINHLSGVFVPQKALSRKESYLSNNSKTAIVSKSFLIPNEDLSDDTTPSVARKFLNECDECKYDKISYDKAYKDMQQKIERLQAQLGDLKGKCKDTSCGSDTRNPLSQKLENENVDLEFQVLNCARENDHLKAKYKNLFDYMSVSLIQEGFCQKENTQDMSVNTKFAKQPIVENLPKVGKTNALSNPVTSNSVSTPQESKGVNIDKVISPGMFRITPSKTSREENHVPNTVRASARTKPITVSQPHVITKKDVNSELNGLSSTGVDHTKTRRPQPRSNIKNDRVPSMSKSSRSKNKEAKVEEHHRNLLLSKNNKHIKNSCGKNKKAKVSVKEIQMKYQPKVTKSKKVEHHKSLATPKPRKPRFLLRWSPTGRLFDQEGKLATSSNPKSQYDCSNGDNACNSNTMEPKIKRFPNSTYLLDRVYFIEGLGHNLFSIGQFCDSDLEVAFRRNVCFVKNIEGVDLLKGDRSTNLYTINLHEMASSSPICLMARASSTKSWLWHQRLSHLNFDTINELARHDLVAGLPKFKYHREYLCPSCEQGKIKRASRPPKPVLNSRQRLHLLHMDLCGPMRIASINGKRYVLVIMDDYSRYMWVHFLRSKDKALDVIIKFMKRITILLQSPVIIIRIDNGSEFKNQVLKEYFDTIGISHQLYSVRTPQQNGAIATACFTQNRSIIHRRFNKTPYELINGRKPDISFPYVFGALCYPKNDREDIGKLGAKGDIGFFIGSKPRLNSMTSGYISLGLDLTYAPSTITMQQPSEGELDLLFEAMYDDYIGGQPSASARTVLPTQEHQVRQTSTASATIADTAPIPTNSSSLATNILISSQDVDELNPNAMVDGNMFVNPFANSSINDVASSS